MSATLEAERDRWFLWVPVMYGVGVALYFALAGEPRLELALAIVAIALVLAVVVRSGTLAVAACSAALALALGFAAAKLRTEAIAAPVLERQLTGVEVRGWVELVEPRAGRGERLTVRVASIRGVPSERLPRRVRVTARTATAGLGPGAGVRMVATLAPPPIPALPGGYDFARQAFFRQIGGVGYSLSSTEIDERAGPAPTMLQAAAVVERVRQAISRRVRAGLEGENGAIADALITGERGGISEATNEAYRGSGIFHILSISGLHMTVMAGAVFFATRLLLAAVPAVALRFPIKKWAAMAAILAALGYLLISGGAFATVRSWLMISVMFLAVMLDRPAVSLRNVAVSSLLILVALPESILDIGFQMSYAAVVALVSAYEALRGMRGRPEGDGGWRRVLMPLMFFGGIILTTLIASVAVAPFGVYHFHNSQQFAVFANLIAIPVCNIIVMPAALATLVLMPFGLEGPALWVMGWGIEAMNWCAFAVSSLPGAVVKVQAIPGTAFASMVVGGLWLCIWRTRWRLLGLVGIAAGVALAPTKARPDLMAGNNGHLLAVRGANGELVVQAGKRARFELSRWLENDGDSRPVRDVMAAGGFQCDGAGCTARTRGVVVAVARHHTALRDDCSAAGVLILTFVRPRACVRDGPVIDLADLRDGGTHAVYLDRSKPGGIGRIETVAEVRGDRPWVQRRGGRPGGSRFDGGAGFSRGWLPRWGRGGRSSGQTAGADRASRVAQFAAPFELSDDRSETRPEAVDEDGLGQR